MPAIVHVIWITAAVLVSLVLLAYSGRNAQRHNSEERKAMWDHVAECRRKDSRKGVRR